MKSEGERIAQDSQRCKMFHIVVDLSAFGTVKQCGCRSIAICTDISKTKVKLLPPELPATCSQSRSAPANVNDLSYSSLSPSCLFGCSSNCTFPFVSNFFSPTSQVGQQWSPRKFSCESYELLLVWFGVRKLLLETGPLFCTVHDLHHIVDPHKGREGLERDIPTIHIRGSW